MSHCSVPSFVSLIFHKDDSIRIIVAGAVESSTTRGMKMRETPKHIAVGFLAAVAMACGSQSSSTLPAAPTVPAIPSSTPVPTTTTYRLSGAVQERTRQGAQPIANASVNLWVDTGRFGYSYWWMNGPVYSDASGKFQMPNLPPAIGWLTVYKEGYVQQCALPAINLDTNAENLEVTLVARENASVDKLSVPGSVRGRILAGRIVENTPSGVQPVAGAFVGFDPVPAFPVATTYSDANGRYLLCGLSDGGIGVELGNRYAYVSVPRDQTSDFDITLP